MRLSIFLKPIVIPLVFLSGIPAALLFSQSPQTELKVIVRAHSGVEAAMEQWSPTMDFLSQSLEGYSFTLLPVVEFDDMRAMVANREAGFILTNPAAYIELEMNYGVSRIATLINGRGEDATNRFGSVIFTRSKHDGINGLEDVRGHSIMGVHREAFGGWWMALGELKARGIEPDKDCSSVLFTANGQQESVVFSVRDGEADIGVVRTGILESLARTGDIDLSAFKILGKKDDDFSLPHSTALYPEWAISKLPHVGALGAEKVALALFEMKPRDAAAIAGGYKGWTVPLDYTPVHSLLKDLRVGPYVDYGRIYLVEVISKYRYGIALIILAAVACLLIAAHVNRINNRLILAQSGLRREIEEKEKLIGELQLAANEIKTLRGILPICSYCKNVRNDDGYYEQIEEYVYKRSDVDFSHTVCPECMRKHYPECEEELPG